MNSSVEFYLLNAALHYFGQPSQELSGRCGGESMTRHCQVLGNVR